MGKRQREEEGRECLKREERWERGKMVERRGYERNGRETRRKRQGRGEFIETGETQKKLKRGP